MYCPWQKMSWAPPGYAHHCSHTSGTGTPSADETRVMENIYIIEQLSWRLWYNKNNYKIIIIKKNKQQTHLIIKLVVILALALSLMVLWAIVVLGMIHEEAAAGLTCLTHACACEVLIREGRLTTLDLPTELLIDGLRKVKIAWSLSNFLCQILNPKNQVIYEDSSVDI